MEKSPAIKSVHGVYNYDTFRREMLKEDAHLSGGPAPGEPAPDFTLPAIAGGTIHLSSFRGIKPLLLVFGSIMCPMTAGARPGLVRLFAELKEQIAFVSVYIREPHPGERYPRHTSEVQKARHARDWAEHDRIPWVSGGRCSRW